MFTIGLNTKNWVFVTLVEPGLYMMDLVFAALLEVGLVVLALAMLATENWKLPPFNCVGEMLPVTLCLYIVCRIYGMANPAQSDPFTQGGPATRDGSTQTENDPASTELIITRAQLTLTRDELTRAQAELQDRNTGSQEQTARQDLDQGLIHALHNQIMDLQQELCIQKDVYKVLEDDFADARTTRDGFKYDRDVLQQQNTVLQRELDWHVAQIAQSIAKTHDLSRTLEILQRDNMLAGEELRKYMDENLSLKQVIACLSQDMSR